MDSRPQARRNQSVYMKAWPKPSLLHVHAPWNCISDHCILRRTVCILTCAHREARHGCVPTYTYPRVHLHSNCTKPQLDIHGVPTLTISSIVDTANMCSGCLPSSLYRFSHLSPPKIIRRPMPFIFFPFPFFFFFIIRAPLEIGLLGYKGNNQQRWKIRDFFFVIFVFLLFFLLLLWKFEILENVFLFPFLFFFLKLEGS